MSAMGEKAAELCGKCDKEFPGCNRDMNECLADDEAKKIDALLAQGWVYQRTGNPQAFRRRYTITEEPIPGVPQ